MLFEKKILLELTQYQKSIKAPLLIYADLESSIKKIAGCKINQEKSSATQVYEHIPCGYSMSIICA